MARLSGSITNSFSNKVTACGLAPTKYCVNSFFLKAGMDLMNARAWRCVERGVEGGGRVEGGRGWRVKGGGG